MDKIKDILKRAVHPKNWRGLYKEYREICNYIIFGVGTTIVSFAVYYIARFLFPSYESVPSFLHWIYSITDFCGIESATALPVILSWIFSVTFAYITNRLWVFSGRAKGFPPIVREALSFYAARLLTLLIDIVIMFLLVDLTGITNWLYEFFAKALSCCVVLVLNYIFSKLFVFRKKNNTEASE